MPSEDVNEVQMSVIPAVDQEEIKALVNNVLSPIRSSHESQIYREHMAQLKAGIARFESRFKDTLKKMRDNLAEMNANVSAVTRPAKDKIGWLSNAVSAWHRLEDDKATAQQAKANQRYEAKVEKAVVQGKNPHTVPLPALKMGPQKKVLTSVGAQTIVTYTHLRAKGDVSINTQTQPDIHGDDAHFKAIPAEFWKLDWQRMKASIKTGQIPMLFEEYKTHSFPQRGLNK